jgi:predicted ribosomally synthesized peptide with nif11-like leader
MNENIKIFLQKVSEDESLQEQLKAIKDPDKAYEFAASVQSGFTKEEFKNTMKELKAKMSRDLSDDDLEKAAGGGITNDKTPFCATLMFTSGMPAAASAAA